MEYNRVIALLLFIGLCATSTAQSTEMSERNVGRSTAVNKSSYAELSNKYGDIEVVSWDKDSVRIEVSIKAYSDKYAWREEMIKSIGVDFTLTKGFVLAETTWKEDASVWRKSTYNVSKEITTSRIEVDYLVHLPSWMPLEIKNTFGNVFMGNHEGELEAEVYHGDFRARNLKKVVNLDVRYGKVKVNSIEKGQIKLGSGSTLDLDRAPELMLSSSSSTIEIKQVGLINIDSRHDDIFLDSSDKIYGSFNLSDLKVTTLNKDLKATCKVGSVRIQDVSEGAERISIDGNKTNIILGLSPEFSGRFQIDVDEDEDLSYPKDMFIVSKAMDADQRLHLDGSVGSREGTQVTIRSTNGYVRIGD